MIDLGSAVVKISGMHQKPTFVYPTLSKQPIAPVGKVGRDDQQASQFYAKNWDDFSQNNKQFAGQGNFLEIYA